MMRHMRTTLTLDPDVERLLRQAMHGEKQGLKASLNAALRRGLAHHTAPAKAFVVEALPMGLRAGWTRPACTTWPMSSSWRLSPSPRAGCGARANDHPRRQSAALRLTIAKAPFTGPPPAGGAPCSRARNRSDCVPSCCSASCDWRLMPKSLRALSLSRRPRSESDPGWRSPTSASSTPGQGISILFAACWKQRARRAIWSATPRSRPSPSNTAPPSTLPTPTSPASMGSSGKIHWLPTDDAKPGKSTDLKDRSKSFSVASFGSAPIGAKLYQSPV